MSLIVKHLRVVGALLLLWACQSDPVGGVALPREGRLVVVDGASQRVVEGAEAPVALSVRAEDALRLPVADLSVTFRVLRGRAALSDAQAFTGADGVARSTVTVQSPVGDTVEVVAESGGRRSASFVLVATQGPGLRSVQPTQLRSGDVMELVGTGLQRARVFIGGGEGAVLAASDTLLRARVPPCLPGGELWVRVERDGGRSGPFPVQHTPQSAPLVLEPAGYVTLDAAGAANCAVLPGDGARYLVAAHYDVGGEQPTDVRGTIAVSGRRVDAAGAAAEVFGAAVGALSAMPSPRAAPSARDMFEQVLRAREHSLAASAAGMPRLGARAEARVPSAPPAVGVLRKYPVIATLSASRFDTVTTRLRFAGRNVLVWVDTAARVDDAVLLPMTQWFDGELYATDVEHFGLPSDVDGDGRVHVVLTGVVNALTPLGQCSLSGFVSGFVSAHDLFPGTPSAAGAEVFYGYVPDETGRFGCPHSLANWTRTMPLTFVHELQHLINFHQKVFVRGGREESVWLNEALSHYAEELASLVQERRYPWPAGRASPEQQFPDTAGWFILNNMINAYVYLREPYRHSLTAFTSGGTLEERGAGWLFVRWLADRFGPDIPRRLVQSGDQGAVNVTARTGIPMERLAGEFALMAVTDSLPGMPRTAVSPALRLTSRNLRSLFDRLGVIINVPPFPLRPEQLAPGQSVTGALRSGGTVYAELTVPVGEGVAVSFVRADSVAWTPGDRARLTLFRYP